MYKGDLGIDLSTSFHGHSVATPIGPAAGPHTQLAQNIVSSFLGGSRIIELKTVQILDQLEIPRPCIDARNICYNVEWSQELTLEESAKEYVKAWILIKVIQELELLGVPKNSSFYNTYFDLSVGYDLKGISSDKVTSWINSLKNASQLIEEQLATLPSKYDFIKKIDINPEISDSITLSTFHGCPKDEIEKIVKYLINDLEMNVVVKLNPTLLGETKVSQILHQNLGYTEIKLDSDSFRNDLQFEDAIKMMNRLKDFAQSKQKHLGAKFTNTLVVKGDQSNLKDNLQYLSGAPLHVISMNTMLEFRKAMGENFPISFSAGIDSTNIVDSLTCNMVPVTTCTDLLKKGGYSRLHKYFKNIQEYMQANNYLTLNDLIRGKTQETVEQAGLINSEKIIPQLINNPHYHFEKNKKAPRKTKDELELFDCINCNICIFVCPNMSNSKLSIDNTSAPIYSYQLKGKEIHFSETGKLELKKPTQIINIAEFCNECSNCDTFCPELGGPFIEKVHFYLNKENFIAEKKRDGFCFTSASTLEGKIKGKNYSLTKEKNSNSFLYQDENIAIEINETNKLQVKQIINESTSNETISLLPLTILKYIWSGVKQDQGYASLMIKHNNGVNSEAM